MLGEVKMQGDGEGCEEGSGGAAGPEGRGWEIKMFMELLWNLEHECLHRVWGRQVQF